MDPMTAMLASLAAANWVSIGASVILALLIVWVARVLIHRSRQPNSVSRINLESLLLNPDGSMDKAAFVLYVALLIMSWGFINLSMRGQMTDAIFIGFGGIWVTPILMKMFRGEPAPAEQLPMAAKPTQVAVPPAGPPGQET